jgi:hypothetical protein
LALERKRQCMAFFKVIYSCDQGRLTERYQCTMGMHTFQEFYFVQDNQKIEISYDHLIVDIAADSFATVILTAPLENFFTVICTDLTVDSTVLV